MHKMTAKRNLIICIVLALILIVTGLAFVLPSEAKAATVKTSGVYKTSDYVKYIGSADGTVASLTNYESGTFQFRNKLSLYDFALAFTLRTDNFDKYSLTFVHESLNETKAKNDENVIELLNEDGKLSARYIPDGDTAEDVELKNLDVDFKGAALEIIVKAKAGATDIYQYIVKTAKGETVLYESKLPKFGEAELKMTFSGVEIAEDDKDDITAEVLVRSVKNSKGTQSLAEVDGSIKDTVDPLFVVDEEMHNKENGAILAGSRTNIDLPVKVFDVLQSSLSTEVKLVYFDGDKEEEVKVDKGRLNIYLAKEGKYKATVSVPNGDDDKETIDIDISTKKDLSAPTATYSKEPVVIHASAGNEYKVQRPEIKDASGVDTKYNVKYTLFYKSPTSSTFSKATDLSFTASSEGLYEVVLMAKDASGNVMKYNTSDKIEYQIYFRDTDAPKITFSSFPKKIYIDEEYSLPSGSVSDTVDSAPTKKVKLYAVKEDGTKGDEIELENNKFTPNKLGKYIAVYTVMDAAHHTTVVEKEFEVVVDDREKLNPALEFFTPWTITLLSIAGASLIGIVCLIFIKPKKKSEN